MSDSPYNDDGPIICTTCSHKNRPGSLLCARCGRVLLTTGKLDTNKLERLRQQMMNLNSPRIGTAAFTPGTPLQIVVDGYEGQPIIRTLRSKNLMVGRKDEERGISPEIDLGEYRAFQYGVSRCHAIIYVQNMRLLLQDLGSSNGTYLGGKRLQNRRPTELHSGDLVIFGRLPVRVDF